MTRLRRLTRSLLFVCLAAVPVVAQAATMDLRVLFDVDQNTSTGCTVDGMKGVDQVLVTRVTDDGTTANVTQTHRQICSGGVLGAPIDVNTSGWPVGFQTSSGHMLIETVVPFSAFGSDDMPEPMRIGFAGTRGTDSFSVITRPNGEPVIFPAGPAGRRRSAAHPGPVRVIILDGLDPDWTGIPPSATGAGGGASDIKLIHALTFADPNTDNLYFNFSINIAGIEAVDDFYERTQGDPVLTEPAPGVLGNDISNGVPLTAIPVGAPDHGTVTLNPDGSFTYQPNDPNSLETDTFEYKATHNSDESNVATVTISVSVVEQAPVFTSANHTELQAGVPANFLITTDGVPAPAINYSGTLPTGVTFTDNGNGTATLGGTPVNGSGGTYVLTLTAINAAGIANQTFTITVCNTITVTNPATNTATAGSPFSQNFTQSGAVGTPTFSLNSGSLPAGLTLASNGTLSGTPTVTGSFGFTVRVTDSNGCIGVGTTYTLTIGCQTITVTNPATNTGTAGSPFSQTFTQTGAIGTATFSTSSTLPAGLTLATNGTLSGTPTQTGAFPITVTVTDSNGCTGTGGTYTLTIGCQTITVNNPATNTGTAGAAFSQTFTQTGAIGGATFTTASTLPAGMTLATNGTLSGTPTQIGTFPITVTVTDGNGCTGTSATYNLTINCQTITVTNPAVTTATVGTAFSQTFTQSGAIGGATFTTASTLPTGFTLSTSGVLSGTTNQFGTFPITVLVTDGNGCTGTSATYNLVVNCQTITVTNPGVNSGVAGTPFSQTFTQVGAIGSATFTTASTLPAGLTLSTAGVLSGTPTQTGTFPIVVTVTDSNGCTGTGGTYTLTIACQTITVTNPANSNGTASSAFSETFTETGAIGGATFTLNSGTLPAGLTLATNGVLSGTPTQTGTFPITVLVTDGNSCTGVSATYTITIACQTITVTNPANANGTASAAFSETFTQTGAIGTTTFTLNSGTLPAGLSLAANGVLSGVPTQTGVFPITVLVTDSNGCTGVSATYNLTIGCQVINVTNPVNTTGTVNAPFSETFSQTGAIGTATFTTASTLPAGLTLATNGTLSGTPTQTGSFPITVTVTDSNGCTGTSATYTLIIGCQTITVTNPVNTSGTVSSAFSETFTQTGAVGGATFTTASTLPAGITLSTAGVLAGIPTQAGSFPIVVTVTDGNGCTGTSATYTLVIACQTITVTNPANATGPAGSPFSETFTQTGAIGSATFTTASTLPTGLTLSTAGVLSGTPTQGGTFPIVVTVTDSNGCTGTGATYTLTITCPIITVTNPGVTTGTAGSPFSQTFTQSGGQLPVSFSTSSTLPAGLSLSTAGVLSGTPTQTGSFPIVVTVTDTNGCTGTGSTYTLVIGCQTITVNNPGVTSGVAGSPFSQTFTQTGAIGGATFTLNSGSLPAGLTLATNGVLSGTPTQTGTFPITVLVTDGNSCTGVSATYNLTITCQTITVTNPATTTGTVNAAFSQTFTQVGAIGTATFTTSSTLPTGFTLSTSGVLSGTTLQHTTFPIVVTVTDSNGCTGTSATYNLTINCQTISVTNPVNTNATVGAPFSETFTETGSISGATFTTSSTLPAGLTLSTAGVLSGTPTQSGSFPITVLVTDGNGCTGTGASYNLVVVCNVITVNNPGVSTGTVDAPFSQTFTQTGANGTPTFTTSSTLPSGLTLSSTGVLSGTPGQPGSFPITVTVTDSNGCTGTSSTYTLVIACQTITVNNPGVTTGTVDAPFSQTFTQTGVGTHTPASFTLNSGSLPSGLTLSTAGVLSGTPGQPGSFPITVKVTDVNGCTGISATYTLVIACQVITVNNPGVNTAIYNQVFSQTFTQTGVGTHTPANFTTSSTLPTGLSLSSAGVLSGTPTQTGTFPITVTVTDANGCTGTSSTYTLAVAPVAVNDTINGGVDNTQLVLTGGSTTTPSTPSVQVAGTIEGNDLPSAGTVTVVPGTFATTGGGSVTVAADGTFLYTPKANPGLAAITSDTFTYTVTSNTGGVAAVTSAAGTVTINLSGRVWYVKNNGSAGDGRSHLPFNTLANAQTASLANDYIFVYFGDGTTTGQNSGITLKNNQKLIGEGVALIVNGSTLVAAGSQPQIGNSGGIGVTATNLTGAVEIRGLNVGATTDAVAVSTNVAGSTNISNNTIRSAGNEGIDIDVTTSAVDLIVSNNAVTATGNGIDINQVSGTATINAFADNSINGNTGGTGVNVVNATFDATTGGGINNVNAGAWTIGAPGNGVSASGMVLTNVAGSLSFTDLDSYADGGAALSADGAASVLTLSVTANAATLVATGGAAANIVDTALDLQLNAMSSATSSANGINLTNVTGTFSAPSGSTITNATSADVLISASSANFTYNGTITDDQGQLVTISSCTGTSSKLFTGAITDGDDGDGSGITISGNSANTTIRFSGGVVLSTGSAAAFSSSGPGILEVCDENPCVPGSTGALINKITSTTGTALSVNGTTIGSNKLEFRSISSNGAPNGIILIGTGSGGLTVNGDGSNTSQGGNSTGGTITSSAGADLATSGSGIYLDNVSNIVLRRMTINGTNQNFGVRGFRVNNLTMEYMTVNGTNGNCAACDNYGEGAVMFGDDASTSTNGVTGSATVKKCIFTGGKQRNFSIVNTTGSLNRITLTGTDFGQVQAGGGNQTLAMEARNAGTTLNVTVDGSTADGQNISTGGPGGDVNFTGQTGTTMDVVFNDNSLSNSHGSNNIGGTNTFATQGVMTMNVFDNTPIRDSHGSAITFQKASAGTSLSGPFNNNSIGVSGVAGSGSFSGNGIFFSFAGGGVIDLDITNNQIRRYNGNGGIFADNTGGSYDVRLDVTGNLTAEPGATAAGGFLMAAGAPSSGDDIDVCVALGGAGGLANNFSAGEPSGLGADILLGVSTAASSMRIVGNNDATPTAAELQAYVLTQNPSAGTIVQTYVDAPATFSTANWPQQPASCGNPPY